MKSRILKIMGVALTLASIAVLTLSGAPVSASHTTYDVTWIGTVASLEVGGVAVTTGADPWYKLDVPHGESGFLEMVPKIRTGC